MMVGQICQAFVITYRQEGGEGVSREGMREGGMAEIPWKERDKYRVK
jgi:hypothetical protein